MKIHLGALNLVRHPDCVHGLLKIQQIRDEMNGSRPCWDLVIRVSLMHSSVHMHNEPTLKGGFMFRGSSQLSINAAISVSKQHSKPVAVGALQLYLKI